jgi:hypothetical protein
MILRLTPIVLSLSLLAACGGDSSKPTIEPAAKNFNRSAVFAACEQISATCDTDTETSAEIVDITKDGMTAVYTDSPRGVIGFTDLSDLENPKKLGVLDVGGEPTSVAVVQGAAGEYALVGVNTSQSFTSPSGFLLVVNIETQQEVQRFDLAGQPDSVAVSPDGKYAAIAIENERDEDLGDGQIDINPQAPAGYLVTFDLGDANPANWTQTQVSMTGLADIAPSDPEPEYVAINEQNVAVVTLQENNHLVLVDLATSTVTADFSAGFADLDQIDTDEEGVIRFDSSLSQVPREPDGVAWINDTLFATADEGDLNGGSRGFTIYNTSGAVVYTSGSTVDQIAAAAGHYPEERSKNKGSEPENLTVATFDGTHYLFLNLERASLTLVYDLSDPAEPKLTQALPALLAPEGVKAVPARNLLVVASEADERGVSRAGLNLYVFGEGEAQYPKLVSDERADGTPIAFSALSALTADGSEAGFYFTTEDSAFTSNRILRIDANQSPARVVSEITLKDTNDVLASTALFTGPQNQNPEVDNNFDAEDRAALINADKTVNLDPEGLAVASDGGFWLANEGSGTINDPDRPIETLNWIIKTNSSGVIERVISLPEEVISQQIRFGFEGVSESDGKLVVAFQRAWLGQANPWIGVYDLTIGTWSFTDYPLDAATSQNGGWVGLSDIAALGAGRFAVIERDNQMGFDASIKRIYEFDLNASLVEGSLNKTLRVDLLDQLRSFGGLVVEKIEGLAVDAAGQFKVLSDNDGVDDNSGETVFFTAEEQ